MFNSIKTGVLALILISTALFAHAQKQITEGTVVYTITALGIVSEPTLKFKDNLSSLHIQMGPASVQVITNLKDSVSMVLVDVPVAQKQWAAKMTKEDMAAQKDAPTYSDFKATNEKKVISNYNAEKYTTKGADGKEIELWVTTDVEIPLNTISAAFKGVKGMIVQLSSPDFSFILKSVKEEKVGELSTTKIPDGYEELSYAELAAMQGG